MEPHYSSDSPHADCCSLASFNDAICREWLVRVAVKTSRAPRS